MRRPNSEPVPNRGIPPAHRHVLFRAVVNLGCVIRHVVSKTTARRCPMQHRRARILRLDWMPPSRLHSVLPCGLPPPGVQVMGECCAVSCIRMILRWSTFREEGKCECPTLPSRASTLEEQHACSCQYWRRLSRSVSRSCERTDHASEDTDSDDDVDPLLDLCRVSVVSPYLPSAREL